MIIWNVNGLNAPITRHRVTDDNKTRSIYMLLIRDSVESKRHTQTESEQMEKVTSCKWKSQESGDSKTHIRQNIFKNKWHQIMIKWKVKKENITLLNIYASNSEAPKYIKQILNEIKWETDNNTIIGGDFNTPHTPMDRLSRQKITRATVVLNDTTDKLIFRDI